MDEKLENSKILSKKIDDELYNLIHACKKTSPLYKNANKNVFKCFVREIMKICNCNDKCTEESLKKIDHETLCDKWDTNAYYTDERYLGCYVPVYSRINIYSTNDQKGFENDLISKNFKFDEIKTKYLKSVKEFNTLSIINDKDNKYKAFDEMRCAVLDVREYCQGKKTCEKDFFDNSSFKQEEIPVTHLEKFEQNLKNSSNTDLVWKFTDDITKMYESNYNISKYTENKLDIDIPSLNKSRIDIIKLADIPEVSVSNNLNDPHLNEISKFDTSLKDISNIGDISTSKSFPDITILSSKYFSTSVVILLVIGLFLNFVASNLTWKSKKFNFLIGLVLIVFVFLLLIGGLNYF